MKTNETEIEAAVRSVIAAGRRRHGPPPSVEDLIAYDRGQLSPEEEDRIQELLAIYPDSVKILEAVASYPHETKPGDPDHLTAEELERDWQAIRDHLPADQVLPFPAPAPRKWRQWTAAIAATLSLAVMGGALYRSLQQVELRGEPRTEMEKRILIPDRKRTVRGVSEVINLPPAKENYLLTLSLFDQPTFPGYRLDILDLDNLDAPALWQTTRLERRPDDTFDLFLPGAFLNRKRVQFQLWGLRDGEERMLATYTVDF